MACIRKEISLTADPDKVWDALRDCAVPHRRLVPGFVLDSRLDGGDRVVTFFTGAMARERLVALDDEQRRVAYTLVESALGLAHHNASAQVLPDGDGGSRFIWITDLLPDDRAARVDELMGLGFAAVRRAFESRSSATDDPSASVDP